MYNKLFDHNFIPTVWLLTFSLLTATPKGIGIAAKKSGGTMSTTNKRPSKLGDCESRGVFIKNNSTTQNFENPAVQFNYFYDWMKDLADNLTLGQLSIPGTHNSISRYGGSLVATQTLPLASQLDYGIRVFDIRCRHVSNACAISHGFFDQHAHLDDILNEVVSFLNAYRTEVVIVRLKEECILPQLKCTSTKSNRTLNATIKEYLSSPLYTDYIWRGTDRIPTLGESRGKIVILDELGNGTIGPRWSRCGICDSPCSSPCIQDEYKVNTLLPSDINKKWNFIVSHLNKTNSGSSNNIYLNFLSGSSILAFPYAIANRVNILFVHLLRIKTLNYKILGAIMMDFPLPEQISLIIDVNFHAVSSHVKLYENQNETGDAKIFTIMPGHCIHLSSWNKRVLSIDTFGKCVTLWERSGCAGMFKNLNTDKDKNCTYNLAGCCWNDRASSISQC